MDIRRDARSGRHLLAHPDISDARVVTAFLKDIEDENPVLTPLEVAAFNHIKSTADFSDANIREANRCRGYNL